MKRYNSVDAYIESAEHWQYEPRAAKKEYANYIAEAKRDETKQTRITKILPMITAGEGLNDKYR